MHQSGAWRGVIVAAVVVVVLSVTTPWTPAVGAVSTSTNTDTGTAMQAAEFSIEIDPLRATTDIESTDSSSTRVYNQWLTVRTTNESTVQLGETSNYKIRVVAPESGRSITITPENEDPVSVSRFRVTLGNGSVESEAGLTVGFGSNRTVLPVSVTGNTSALSDGIITAYRVEIIGQYGTVVAETGTVERAVGYRAEFVTNGTHIGVQRNPEVTADYTVKFRTFGGETEFIIPFDADDQWFVVSLDRAGVTLNDGFSISVEASENAKAAGQVVSLTYAGESDSLEPREVSGPITAATPGNDSDGSEPTVVARFDADGSGTIDSGELLDALAVYDGDAARDADSVNNQELLELLAAYNADA